MADTTKQNGPFPVNLDYYQGLAVATLEHYRENGRPAIKLWSEYGEPLDTITVNVPGLAGDEIAIKEYGDHKGNMAIALAQGWVEPPHRTVPSGYVDIPVCRIKQLPAEEE